MSLLLEVVPERETLTPHPPGTILNHCAIAFKPLLFLMWICIYKRKTIADFKTVLHLIVIKILRLTLILWLSRIKTILKSVKISSRTQQDGLKKQQPSTFCHFTGRKGVWARWNFKISRIISFFLVNSFRVGTACCEQTYKLRYFYNFNRIQTPVAPFSIPIFSYCNKH